MRKYLNDKFPHLVHGADYNPEQWREVDGIWDEDMRLMQLANCNEMTVGIFSWAKLEPKEGEYDFSFLDEIIEKVGENGGKIVLATPSGARPHWLADKYNEVLRVDEHGVRQHFGVRHNHCYTSPIYREKVKKINGILAQRYGNNETVIAWHISNEYGGKCYCPLCQNAFRGYLKKRYDNDIKKLNQAYWSDFWSHTYDNFEQIEAPMPIGEMCIHGLNLDWRRFCSYQTLDFMKAEISAIRQYNQHLPITTNMIPWWYDLNYNEFAEDIDIASWDAYPDWHNADHIRQAIETGFWHDYFRALKDRPFMLMESAPGLVNWKEVNKLKRPGMDTLASLQTIAHGGDSVQYFQWRKSRGSVEKFHGAVVDHVGTEHTRIFKAVQKTGQTLKTIDEVAGSTVQARVAILYDWESRWALDDSQGFQKDKRYSQTCVDYYTPLWKRGIAVDIIGPNKDFEKYDLIIAPMQYMTTRDLIEKIERYVKDGGHFYATYMLGMVNETDLCYLGGFPGERLKEVFGIWNEEIDTLYPEERGGVEMDGVKYLQKDYAELIHANTATVLARYTKEFYVGMPALTVNTYGKGKAYYQAFRDEGAFTEKVLSDILMGLNIQPTLSALPKQGVTAHCRTDVENTYLFVENYNAETVEGLSLDGEWTNMATGEQVSVIDIEAYSIAVLKRKNKKYINGGL